MLLDADFPGGNPGLYGTTTANMLNGRFAEATQVSLIDDPDPAITGTVVFMDDSPFYSDLRKVLPTSVTTLGLSQRIWFPSLPSSTSSNRGSFLLCARNVSAQPLVSVRVETDGRISVLNGAAASFGPFNNTVVATSTLPAIVANGWQQVEIKVVFHDTTGSVTIVVDGVTVLTATNIDTLAFAGPCTQFSIGRICVSATTSGRFMSKDWAIWDDTGTANNNFLGQVFVWPLLTNADVAMPWLPSTGTTGWDLIDESPPVDSDYIAATPAITDPAIMSLTDLPTDVTSVRGLVAVFRGLKTDGGDGAVTVGMVSNGDVLTSSNIPLTTSATYWKGVFEVDPDTGSAWTPTAVNDADVQFDRTV